MSSAGRRGALQLAVLLASLVVGSYASRCPGGVLSNKFDCTANSYGCSEVCNNDQFPGSAGSVTECTIGCEYHVAMESPSLSTCYARCSSSVCKPSLCMGSCAVDPVCVSHCERGCVLAEELMRCCDTDFPVTCAGHCNEEANGGLCLRNSPRGYHVCLCFDGFALPYCEVGDDSSPEEPMVRQVTDGSFLTVPGSVLSAHSSGRFLVTGVPGRLDGNSVVMGGAYISTCEPDAPSQPCSSPKLLPMPANLSAFTYFGFSVSVEASGFVVVGTQTTEVAGTGAYVYFCSATGDCSPPRALSVQREYATGSFGWAVTVARYRNGDAIVAVGAPMDDSGHGVVYLWRCEPASSPTSSAPVCSESNELRAPTHLQYLSMTNPMRFGSALASTMNLLDSPGSYGLVVGAPLAAMQFMRDGAAFYYRINQDSVEPNVAATLALPYMSSNGDANVGSVVAISSSGQTIAMSTAYGITKTMVVNCRTDAFVAEQLVCSAGTVIDNSYYQLASGAEQWKIALSDHNTLILGATAQAGMEGNDAAVFDCKVHEGTDPRAPNCTGPVFLRNGTHNFGSAVAASNGQAFIATLAGNTLESNVYRFSLCPEGRFGPKCANDCGAGCAGRCTDTFSGNGDGGCSACSPGYTGAPACNLCAPGFVNRYGSCICDVNRFGVNCTGVCPACENDYCADGISGSGECSGNCKSGFVKGADGKCSECASMRYGPQCEQCPLCAGGRCHDGIGGDGKCLCHPNYMRSREDGPCDICAPGYYGPSCQPCTVECSAGSKCNDTLAGDGQCTCPTGYGRDEFGDCSACAPGYYRNGTLSSCFKCADCGPGGVCDPINGACYCTTGWQQNGLDGNKCSACSPGYYGDECKQCESCANNGTCRDTSAGDGSCHCSDVKYDPATRCRTCREGWVAGAGGNCDPCHWSCKACTGMLSNQCTACYGDLVLVGTQCLDTCPDGQFKQGNLCVSTCSTGFFKAGNVCTACPAGCANCGSATTCDTCTSGYFKHNGVCVQQCPTGLYGSGATCEKCHESCVTCSGGSETSCVICPPGKTYTSGRCTDPNSDEGAASSASGFLLALIVGVAAALRVTRF